MKAPACPRLPEAEAVRDGRLAGAELASFARHSAVCPACRREAQALDELAEALRASPNDGEQTDELHTVRERTRLIAAFAQSGARLRQGEATPDHFGDRRPAWRRALGPAAAAALVAGALLFGRTRPAPSPAASAGLVVEAGASTVWSKHSAGYAERLVLEQGELRIRVDHSRHQTRLVVALPDGELEDVGTTFTVSVANGHTARVAVHEGLVILRIREAAPVALAAGAVWTPRPAAPASTRSPGEQAPTKAPARVRPPIVPRTAMARSVGAPEPPDPGVEFRAAVAVFETGANREAAAAFARFLVEHPRDPRAEDAAYLRVIALERCGAAPETRRAAQAYLQLYPQGFRRTEIEKLSQPTETTP